MVKVPAALYASALVLATKAVSREKLISKPIPSSGEATPATGYALAKPGKSSEVSSTDKVWIPSPCQGHQQMEVSRRYRGVPGLDLMQV